MENTWILALSAVPMPGCHAGSQTLLPLRGPQTYQAFSWDTAAAGQCDEASVCVSVGPAESTMILTEFPSVLGSGNCRDRPLAV